MVLVQEPYVHLAGIRKSKSRCQWIRRLTRMLHTLASFRDTATLLSTDVVERVHKERTPTSIIHSDLDVCGLRFHGLATDAQLPYQEHKVHMEAWSLPASLDSTSSKSPQPTNTNHSIHRFPPSLTAYFSATYPK